MLSEDSTRARRMNIFDPYGDYQKVQLTGGVYIDDFAEKRLFIINDPLSLNLYAYCQNNPIMFIDPSGHTSKPTPDHVTKDKPPTEKDGYVAPKGGPKKAPSPSNPNEKGWVDKNGNVWVPCPDGTSQAHGGGHWDVNRPDGRGYVNKYPGGHERAGKGQAPNLPPVKAPSNSTAAGIGVFAVVVIIVAVALAPETGGASLGLLAIA